MPRNNRTNRRPQPRRRPANENQAVDIEVQMTPEVGDYVAATDGYDNALVPRVPLPPVARVHDEYMISPGAIVDESSPAPTVEDYETFGASLSRRMMEHQNAMFAAAYGANYEQIEQRVLRANNALDALGDYPNFTVSRAAPSVRGTYTVEWAEPAEPSHETPIDPFRDPNLAEYMRDARRHQAERVAEQERAYRQTREAEAAEARRRAQEELRLEQERQENEARTAALSMRYTIPADALTYINQEIENYYGTGWLILGAFKMDELYRRYVGNPGSQEYFAVFAAPEGAIRDNNVQIIIFRRREPNRLNGAVRYTRDMTERYDHILCSAPSGITRPLRYLYNYATLRGRSVTVTGGQLLMDYALNDRNILAELNKQYHPEVAESARRAMRFNQIVAASTPSFDAEEQDRPRTPRGSAAANAAARHPRQRQPVEA